MQIEHSGALKNMKLKFITELAEIERSQEQWDSVAGGYPFFRFAWMANWFRYFGSELKLAVLIAVGEDGQWKGIAPWCIDESNPFIRKLRFLGSGCACSDYLDLIVASDDYRSFSTLTVDWLMENIGNAETLGRIDVIELEGITNTNSNTAFLCEVFEAWGLKSHSTELEGGWQVDLPSTWQELNARFSKSMRRKTKAAIKRINNPASEVLSTQNESFDELWPMFVALHQGRRKMLGQAGCFADPSFEMFLQQASKDLMEEDSAELLVILFEGRPLATKLCLFGGETVYFYQSGIDVERMNLEPGYQICYSAISRAIERGFKRFDFLRGDEPYKSRWDTTRIPMSRIRFVPPTSIAKLKHGIWLTGRSFKNYVSKSSIGAGS